MNILITGGAGNIASALAVKVSQNSNNSVVLVDNLLTGSLSKIPISRNVNFIKADVNDFNDLAPIFSIKKFDAVFHFAAVVGVKRTLENPLWVLRDIDGIRNILQLSKNTGVKRVFYSSSSEVYGEPFEIPQNELTTPLNSRLPYAVVKNVGEAYFRSYYQEFNLEYTIFRFFNTYGPNQSEDFVIPKFVKKALKNDIITIYGDGRQTRTFCYVDDNIDACLGTLYKNMYVNDVINIGGDEEYPILELAQIIIKLTNSKSEIVHLPPLPEGDMTRRKPDLTKMEQLLDRPRISLEEGIKKLIQQYTTCERA
jgi:UDP-glucuronate decarboxylase